MNDHLTLCSVYSLFSALIMHVYQMRSSNKSIVAATEQRLQLCMNALKEVSKVWLVAKMVHTLFESILGNKSLEERLQKAAGKRHKKHHHHNNGQPPVKPKEEPPKRKFDDIDMGFGNGPPAPQVSYERSRPQTPSLTPSRELNGQQQQPQHNQQQQLPQMTAASPQLPRQNSDAFMGGPPSRSQTRPTTPFNPSYSYPGTPPELFLVTRNSPNISQDLWQNFQPDQLFPADPSITFPQISPTNHHNLVDPSLQQQQQQQQQQNPGMHPLPTPPNMGQHHMQGQQHMTNGMGGMNMHQNDANGWAAHMEAMNSAGSTGAGPNEETWSNSSRGNGPIVPTTLNVEDWYVQASNTGHAPYHHHPSHEMPLHVQVPQNQQQYFERLARQAPADGNWMDRMLDAAGLEMNVELRF